MLTPLLGVVAAFLLVHATPSGAQTAAEPPVTPDTVITDMRESSMPVGTVDSPEIERRLDGVRLILDQAETTLQRDDLGDAELTAILERVEPLIDELRGIGDTLAEPLADLRQRLDRLGPPPEEGQPPEATSIAQERADLAALIATIDAAARRADLLAIRATQAISEVAENRRDRFTRMLSVRERSILSPTLWIDSLAELPDSVAALTRLFANSFRAMANRTTPLTIAALAGSILAAILLVTYVRRRVFAIVRRDSGIREPDDFLKIKGAASVALIDAVLPIAAIGLVYGAINTVGMMPDRFRDLVATGVGAFAIYATLTALSRAYLAPTMPAWRIISYTDAMAWRLHRLTALNALVIATVVFLDKALDIIVAPLALEVTITGVSATLIALIGIAAMRAAAEGHRGAERHADEDLAIDDAPTVSPARALVRVAIYVATIVILLAALTGYIAFAGYLSVQLIFAGAILAGLYLLMAFVDQGFSTLASPSNRIGRGISRAIGVSTNAVAQAGVVISGVLRLILIIIAAVMILTPWGFETSEWMVWLRRAFFGFQIGDVTISVSAILAALALFSLGIALTRAFQSWLDVKYLPRTKLDTGIKTSLRVGLGYVGIIAAAAFAVSFIGLDLANLAIVAGALSVGIGFGLQSIVNNFVSGLILLAERPIKVGDWIIVAGEQGYVRRISVRATRIETFDRAMVVVPNSDLISGVVKNMMLGNQMGRVVLKVGVSYGSDADLVREILLDVARNHAAILAYPEPKVFFLDFGASSLDFGLYAFIPDVDYSFSVHSDLRFAVLKRFREANIEIPFPQRDLHLRSSDIGTLPNREAPEPETPEPEPPEPAEKDVGGRNTAAQKPGRMPTDGEAG